MISYHGLGHRTGIKEISSSTTTFIDTTTNNNHNSSKKPSTNTRTRTIRISEELYKKFFEHSRRYYNTEPYETILENLLNCYDEHNQDKYWFNMDR